MKLQQADDAPSEVVEEVVAPREVEEEEEVDAPREVVDAGNNGSKAVTYDSDAVETDDECDEDDEEREEERASADLGGGWGRIVFMPVRRGRQVTMNVCRSTKRDASEGSFDRIVLTKSKNPTMHQQAKKSIWGDLWPF